MKNSDLKIIFFGTPQFIVPVLSTIQKNFNLLGVVTSPDKKVGRKQLLTPSSVKQFYQSSLGSCLTPEHFTPDVAQQLTALKPDLFVVAAFGKIIPENILDIAKFGAINIHPSLLPKYRGPSPIQSAILNGDKISGISIIKMDAGIDHGPVIYAEEFSLSSVDNFETLSTKMFLRSAEILPKVIPAFVGGKLKPELQNHAIASYCNLVKKEDGYFDIDNPPKTKILDRMIRAYYPWPTAWTGWKGKILKFLPFSVIPTKAGIHRSCIKYRMTGIEIQNDKFLVQMEGKKPIVLKDFLNGYPNFPIKSL